MDLPLLDGTLDSLEEGEESQGDSQEEGTSTLMEVDSISTQVWEEVGEVGVFVLVCICLQYLVPNITNCNLHILTST